MTEPTPTFPVVPIDMASICQHLHITDSVQHCIAAALAAPLEGELMFALPRVTQNTKKTSRSRMFAPNVAAVVTLTQLNLLLSLAPRLYPDLRQYAFHHPFVGVFKQREMIGKNRWQWNIIAARRAPTLGCFYKEGGEPPCAGDSLLVQWSTNTKAADRPLVRLLCVGIGKLTNTLQERMTDDTTDRTSVITPIGVLKHAPGKVTDSETFEAMEQEVLKYATHGNAQPVPHIGKFHLGLVDVELGCHM